MTASPTSGYEFVNWSGDVSSTSNPLNFTITQDTSVTANFQQVMTPVVFTDANLEAAIRAAISRPTGDIFASDLTGLTELNASNRGITSLSGIEYCENLQRLHVHRNAISDLSPLAGLTNLTYINLNTNSLAGSALGALSNLINLTYLNVSLNQLTTLDGLAPMTLMQYFLADYNRIVDISPLMGKTQLKELWLRGNLVADLSPLSGLTALTVLFLNNNQIANVTALQNLTNLQHLSLSSNQVVNIAPLQNLTALKSLYLSGNQITDLQPLVSNSGLGAGDTVNVANNPLSLVSGNTYIPQLQARGVTVVYTGTYPPNAPSVNGQIATNDTTPTWTWVSGGGGGNGTFRYQLDGQAGTWTQLVGTSFTPTTALSATAHTLYVQERNAAGYWSASGSFSTTIDVTPPVAPVVSGTTPSSDTTPTWNWTSGGGGNGTYRYKLDDPNLGTGATSTVALNFTPSTDLTAGTHTLYVQERDAAGNWSPTGSFSIEVTTGSPTGVGVLWGCTTGAHSEIFRVNTFDGTITAHADYGAVQFGDIAASPSGAYLYVTHIGTGYDQLSQVDASTLDVLQTWTLPSGVSINALDWKTGSASTMYGIQQGAATTSMLYEITVTGTSINVVALGTVNSGMSDGDLAWDPVTTKTVGTFMPGDTTDLWEIDVVTPANSVVGPALGSFASNTGRVHVDGLAFDSAGTLWGASNATNTGTTYSTLDLYTIDLTSGPAGLEPVWDLSVSLQGDGITGLCRAENLCTNGSFEFGTDPGTATKLKKGSTDLNGWVIGGAGVYYVGTYYQAADGIRCVKLTLQKPGSIAQIIETTPGRIYSVKFKMAGDPYPYLSPAQKIKELRVTASSGNTELAGQNFTFDTTGRSVNNMGWANRSWTFTAVSSSTEIKFTSVSPGPYGPTVDKVVVSAQ